MTAAQAPTPALWVGRADPPDVGALEAAGFSVLRAETVVQALDILAGAGGHGVPVAIVHGDALGARETERWEALRRAGAAVLVGVYPPSVAWRADRAASAGADLGIALPAPPGAIAAVCRRLAAGTQDGGAPAGAAAPAAPVAGAAPRTAAPGETTGAHVGADRWAESVLADAAAIHRALSDFDRLLALVVEDFARRTGARRVSVLLRADAGGALVVRRTTAPLPPGAPAPEAPADGLAAHVAQTGRTAFVADVDRPSSDLAAVRFGGAAHGYATRACLVLPLDAGEGVLGTVCLADPPDGSAFHAEDVTALEALALQAAQALATGAEMRRLRELASIDELTGLANRRQFGTALELEFQRARRYDRPVSLALFDIDHFKSYNDTCGHPAGDRALAKVGEILRSTFREVDVVARYGGEEFAVILPETSAGPSGQARNPFPFLERLRRRIEETVFPGAEKLAGGRLTISGGVASFPDDAATSEDLIREADEALYASKARGRNTITYRGRAV